jgi:signal transduction histidine kinase
MFRGRSSPYRGVVLQRMRTSLLGRRRQDLADLALAGLIATLAVAETMAGGYEPAQSDTSVILLDLAVTLPLAVRRRHPVATFLAILVAIDLRALALGDIDSAGVFFGLLVGGYSLGAHTQLRWALAGMVAFIPAMMWANWLDVGNPFNDLDFMLTLVGGFWLVGRVVWSRNRLVDRLAEQSEELRRSREAEARARAAEQRARIGRDVHDVVAHSVTLMVVQAEAGEAQLEADHPSVDCFQAIQRVGRSTLVELRGVLGGLGEESVPTLPQGTTGPGLHDAGRLGADLVEAGLDLELRVEPGGDDLTPDLDLAAYRILQEALTNALRHCPGAHVDARVHVTPEEIVIEVTDDGSGPHRTSRPGSGRGLAGMRERAHAHGGDITAGPVGTGFTVRARLPLQGSPESVR